MARIGIVLAAAAVGFAATGCARTDGDRIVGTWHCTKSASGVRDRQVVFTDEKRFTTTFTVRQNNNDMPIRFTGRYEVADGRLTLTVNENLGAKDEYKIITLTDTELVLERADGPSEGRRDEYLRR